MAATEAYSGTETVGTTEWSMTTDTSGPDNTTAAGTYQAFIDLSALAAGDLFRLRVYEKVLSAGTQRVVGEFMLSSAAVEPHAVTPALILMHGWDMTLTKIAGTDRSISWSIRTP